MPIQADRIIAICASHFRLTIEEMKGKGRAAMLVEGRHAAMYLCRTMTSMPLSDIAAAFTKVDHTTVINAMVRISQKIEHDELFRRDMELLASEVRGLSRPVDKPPPAPSFVEKAISLHASAHPDEAMELIFDTIDDFIMAARFDSVSNLLAAMPVDRMSMPLLLAVLSATSPRRKHLAARPDFIARIEAKIASDPDRETLSRAMKSVDGRSMDFVQRQMR